MLRGKSNIHTKASENSKNRNLRTEDFTIRGIRQHSKPITPSGEA